MNDPMSPDALLELPFDQYQRYRIATNLLVGLGIDAGSTVLEVGGAPGPVEAFLPNSTVIVLDRSGKHEGRFLIGDGAALPFPDKAFDAVVTLDTLEHVPGGDRAAFLLEAKRVCRDLLVLSAPFADPAVELAEDALNEFVRNRFQTDFPTLDEHRQNGLPELDAVTAAVRENGWSAATLPSGYLPRWLAGMLVHHELLAIGLPSLPKIHAYYNQNVSSFDTRSPAYRQVVVASRSRKEFELDAIVGELRSSGDESAGLAALQQIAGLVLGSRLDAAIARSDAQMELDRRAHEIEGLERTVADRDAHLLEVRMLAVQLRAERDEALRRADEISSRLEAMPGLVAEQIRRNRLAERVLSRARRAADRRWKGGNR